MLIVALYIEYVLRFYFVHQLERIWGKNNFGQFCRICAVTYRYDTHNEN